jgi:hypothetical protein
MAKPWNQPKDEVAITKRKFCEDAPDSIEVKVGDLTLQAKCKVFGANAAGERSVGFGFNDKLPILVGTAISKICTVNGESCGETTLTRKTAGKNPLYNFGRKITIMIDETPVEFQVGVNLIVTKQKNCKLPFPDSTHTCMVGINITAVGSKKWEDGGDLSGWMKTVAEAEAEDDSDDNDEDDAPAKSNGKASSKKPSGKPKSLTK